MDPSCLTSSLGCDAKEWEIEGKEGNEVYGMGSGPTLRSEFDLEVEIVRFVAGMYFPEDHARIRIRFELPASILQVMDDHGMAWKMDGSSTIRRGSTVGFKERIKRMSFRASSVELALALSDGPSARVTMWYRIESKPYVRAGVGRVPLEGLLRQRSVTLMVKLREPEVQGRKRRDIGELRCILRLEEGGFEKTTVQPRIEDSNDVESRSNLSEDTITSRSGSHPSDHVHDGNNHTPSFHVTPIDLEAWKRRESKKLEEVMRQKEEHVMGLIEEEWKRQELRRKAEVDFLTRQLVGLEEKLRKKLHDLEEHERKVISTEVELNHHRTELETTYQNKCVQAQHTVGRLQKDFEHQLRLASDREGEANKRCKELEGKLGKVLESEKKLVVEFEDFKAKHRNAPETKLNGEVMRLSILNKELQRKLQEAEDGQRKAKAQAKSLQDHLFKEIRQREVEQWKRIALDRNQASECSSPMHDHAENKKVQECRSEIAELKKAIEDMSRGTGTENGKMFSIKSKDDHTMAAVDQALVDSERLLQERRELLSTGLYTDSDPLIQVLDRHIVGGKKATRCPTSVVP